MYRVPYLMEDWFDQHDTKLEAALSAAPQMVRDF